MIVLTIIARIGDGLILTESVQHDEETGRTTYEYHSQAKSILRKLNSQSVPVCSIETGPYYFHYLIYENVCYLALCEKSFSKRLAFAYLEDLKNEFSTHYGKMVSTAMRPYSCIEFDTYMQKAKKSYSDNRARRNLTHLNTELQDVQRIMVQNIDDVLQRGAALSELDSKASNLSLLSEKYKKDAHFLNMSSAYTKLAAAATVVFTLLERLTIDRPEKPIDFLYDLIMKSAVYDVPKVYVLGPPTLDRKLVCTALSSKLNLVYLTHQSLKQDEENPNESKKPADLSYSDWAKLMKERVEQPDCVKNGWLMEAFPKTRFQAFALRKIGVFPTHIGSHPEISDILSEEGLQEMLDYLGHVDLILDLLSNSYAKKFQIGRLEDAERSIEKVIEFVRRRKRPAEPYLPRVLMFGPYGSGISTTARRLALKYHLVEVDFRKELRSAALKDSPLKDLFYEIMQTSAPGRAILRLNF
ncbi:vesicle-trafficking protein SEC22b [Trichonephila inaurata madagascariensis]|uniref:Vesicle-trafficking protein SEC22b n=1 Tax=Trichonephila inaurata madagascariensis TaxID=2747483 RepID=A0A8X7C4V8_9ARAC|nr:vesicle-trafficking protein SEC22b [Trichonephila inaurata madagascariensis]